MHRTSRILAPDYPAFLPQAPPCSSPRRRLFRTRWPIRCFLLAVAVFCLRRKNVASGRGCTPLVCPGRCGGCEGSVHSADAVFSRWPTVPISAISSAPGDFLPVLPHGCFPRRCSRCSSPGSCPGSWIRPNGSASPFTVRSSPGCFTACSGIAGRMPHGSASRPCCSFFSDGVIAWSRFIGAVPGRTYVVMVPYYLAQCLFFCFAVKSLPALPSEGRSV